MKDLESLRADAALDLHWTPLTRDTHTAVYHAMLNHHRDQLQYLSSKTLPLDRPNGPVTYRESPRRATALAGYPSRAV